MYPHQTERLDGVLEAFGVDALVATSPADVAYLTGFWSLSHAVFDAEILAVYSKAGTALVIPTIDAPAFAAGDAAADHVACHGRVHVNLAVRDGPRLRRERRGAGGVSERGRAPQRRAGALRPGLRLQGLSRRRRAHGGGWRAGRARAARVRRRGGGRAGGARRDPARGRGRRGGRGGRHRRARRRPSGNPPAPRGPPHPPRARPVALAHGPPP